MEMNLRHALAAAAAALLSALALPAQETTYWLPSTTLVLDVEAQQETFFAGPYAAFAKRMLNMDVRKVDAVTTHVLSVELSPCVEADPQARMTLETDAPELLTLSAQGLIALGEQQAPAPMQWRFLPGLRADFTAAGVSAPEKDVVRVVYKTVPTDTAFVRIPIEEKSKETKSLEDKAAEAAALILNLRQERMNIASGNTDASFSGEALSDALAELRRLEEEYLTLFRGYTVTRPLQASFEVIPSPSSKTHKYLAFRLDPDLGLVSNGRGTPYYIELEPEALADERQSGAKKAKGVSVRYRIPLVCKVRLTEDGRTLLQTRVPFYQLGKESAYTVKNN